MGGPEKNQFSRRWQAAGWELARAKPQPGISSRGTQPNAASPILKGRLSRRLPLAPPASARTFVKNRSKLKGVKMPSSAISTRTYCYE